MPLNPNGKIDKPALPFPDTAQAATTEPARGPAANPTEEAISAIWTRILPNAPSPVPLDESFFDLGGHSILATRLIFEIRKAFLVDAPLGLVFDKPTVAALAGAVERMRNADLGLTASAAPGTPRRPPQTPPQMPRARGRRRSSSTARTMTSSSARSRRRTRARPQTSRAGPRSPSSSRARRASWARSSCGTSCSAPSA